MPTLPWIPGSATGIGSLPGVDPREAMDTVLGELPEFPHLPELPARGPGADLVGRTAALLVDLPVETVAGVWRFADRPGGDLRRATTWLADDLDVLEERAADYQGPFKIQVAGPWTLAATVELRRGEKALADAGACRDLIGSLTEGVAVHVGEVRKRIPAATLVVQIDEPALPAVLAGRVPTQSGLAALPAVEEPLVQAAVGDVIAAVAPSTVLVHCCAASAPIGLIMQAGADGFAIDFSLVPTMDEDALGTALDGGAGMLAGVVSTTEGSRRDAARLGAEMSDPVATVEPVRSWWQRLGLAPAALAEAVVVTPACGLAGATPAYARAAMRRCREAAKVLAEAPEG